MTCLSYTEKQNRKAMLLRQQKSGLCISHWCKENNVPPHYLYRLKEELSQEPQVNASDFTELHDAYKTGVILECHDVRIYLGPDFDPTALLRCIEVLREVSC